MFNETWIALAVLLGILAILLGQSNLLTLAVLLMTIVPAGWVWDRLALRALSYRRQFGEVRAFAGETVPLTLFVTNRKPLPVPWLRIEDSFPQGIALAERELDPSPTPSRGFLSNVVSLRWYERMSWTYHLKCERRGFYFFGPATLRSGDIFGLFQSAGTLSELDRLIVYPRVVPLPELGFPGKEPFGETTGRRAIFEDPVRTVGIRDYHPEDSFKPICLARPRFNFHQVRKIRLPMVL